MKRWLAIVAALFLLAAPASAYWQSRAQSSISVAAGCAEATTFLARTSGLDATHQTAYTTLICGMVTDGVWSTFDGFYITATSTTTIANLNLVSTSFGLTQTGTITFTVDQGYSAAQASSNLDTGFDPSTASSPKYVRDNAQAGAWKIGASNISGAIWGQASGLTKDSLFPRFTDGNMYCDITASSDDATGIAVPTTAAGYASCSRTASTGYVYYKNGSSLGTRTNTSAAVPSGNFQYLNGLATGDFAAAAFGSGLNGTQMANLYARIHVYLQTIAGVP